MNTLKRQLKRPLPAIAWAILTVSLIAALFPSAIAPLDPANINVSARLTPPNSEFWFGTDHLGRDILSRTIHGARLSLMMGFGVALISAAAGVLIGILSAVIVPFRLVAMRLVDVFMAFPAILLALTIMAISGKAAFQNVLIALAIVYIPRVARVAYALSLSIQETLYVEASRASGARMLRVMARHILPNLVSPIIVLSTFTCAWAVLGAASLDFLGVGVPPEIPSWGGMINESRLYITRAPWIGGFAGGTLFLFVMALNIVGDALRDSLDPKLKRLV